MTTVQVDLNADTRDTRNCGTAIRPLRIELSSALDHVTSRDNDRRIYFLQKTMIGSIIGDAGCGMLVIQLGLRCVLPDDERLSS